VLPGSSELYVSAQNLHLLHVLALLCLDPSPCWQSMDAIPFETPTSTAPLPLIPRQHSPLLGSRRLSTLIDPPSSGMILTRASLPTTFSHFLFLSSLVQLHPPLYKGTNGNPTYQLAPSPPLLKREPQNVSCRLSRLVALPCPKPHASHPLPFFSSRPGYTVSKPLHILFPFLAFSLYQYSPLSFGPPSW
jgi:hypothetical protein